MTNVWENADETTVEVGLYTVEEASEQLDGCGALDAELVLAIGGGSGGYFGLEGSSESIRKVLMRALALLDQHGK